MTTRLAAITTGRFPESNIGTAFARLGLNYFQAMITRYVERYRDKNGVEDLRKARHFLDKLIELEEVGGLSKTTVESENQKVMSGEASTRTGCFFSTLGGSAESRCCPLWS
jgi:hypothetical protein